MYDSDQFSMPMPRPFQIYVSQPSVLPSNKPVPARSELDDIAYRQGLPQTVSTENSNENRSELLVSSDMRDFSSCFSSYTSFLPTTMTTMPSRMSVPMPHVNDTTVQEPQFTHIDNHVNCDGSTHEEERKHEREHRKRSKNWTRPETLRLIQARTTLDVKFGRAGKKTELWDQIGDELQRDGFSRDAQQCKDKWEKLSASYKEVKDGIREKDDFVFYDEMHALVSGRSRKRERDTDDAMKGGRDVSHAEGVELDVSGDFVMRVDGSPYYLSRNAESLTDTHPLNSADEDLDVKSDFKYISVMDLRAVQDLLDSYLAKQRRFFSGLLDEIERREQLKEKLRQEREDRWRAEEREQRRVFMNAMIILTQQLIGEAQTGTDFTSLANSFDNTSTEDQESMKKKSKNWKRSEVLHLIKVRIEMDSKFCISARRAEMWEELAETLGAQGIYRDGKQCREKWDKLMAGFKDVADGRRDESESPFYAELKAFMEEGQCNP